MADDAEESTLIADASAVDALVNKERNRNCLTVIAGVNVGQTFRLKDQYVIGRSDKADITIPDQEISRRHARVAVEGQRAWIEDLGSTNGTFVNGERVTKRELTDGDKIQVGTITVLRFSVQDQLDEQFHQLMYESASRDGLTGAYNKTHFLDRIQSEVSFAVRHKTPLSLVLFDIDHFKSINDTHGHLAGDFVLGKLAELVASKIRAEDVFARYGGEEFVVLSRGIDLEAGARLGERLRQVIADTPFVFEERRIPVTISVGVAALPQVRAAEPDALIARADAKLYEAKRSGRNRVFVDHGEG
jgi:diguanylate cyclase (GGDEF)-like protein